MIFSWHTHMGLLWQLLVQKVRENSNYSRQDKKCRGQKYMEDPVNMVNLALRKILKLDSKIELSVKSRFGRLQALLFVVIFIDSISSSFKWATFRVGLGVILLRSDVISLVGQGSWDNIGRWLEVVQKNRTSYVYGPLGTPNNSLRNKRLFSFSPD